MKKVLSLILAVALLTALCTTAFAATSKSWFVEVIHAVNAEVEDVIIEDTAELEEIQVAMEQVVDTLGETEEAKALEGAKLTVLAIREITVEDEKTATMDVVIEGTKKVSFDVALFFEPADGSAMELLTVGKLPMQVETAVSGTLIIAKIG